jgi:thioredoxin-related protein
MNPLLSRRRLTGWLAAAPAALALPVLARDSALPVPASLQAAAKAATDQREPLVLLVSLPGCPYCELVRRSYLLPMRAEGLHAWQIDVTDKRTPVRDFTGAPATGAQLARRWNATFTPTVLFFDARGQELAARLLGIAVPEFYGFYLQEAVATARKKLSEKA